MEKVIENLILILLSDVIVLLFSNFQTLNLGLLKEDATNFVSMVNGYYRIFVDPNKTLLQKNAGKQSDDPHSEYWFPELKK